MKVSSIFFMAPPILKSWLRPWQCHMAVGHRVDICITFGILIVQLLILQCVVLLGLVEIRYFHRGTL
jgi:hypothetical protein